MLFKSWSDIDDIPVKSDGYDYYSVTEYVRNRETNSGWRSNNEVDFPTTLKQYGMDRAVASGEVDEVWIFEDHYFGAWEASMAAQVLTLSTAVVYPEVDSERPFAIMGFSYEQLSTKCFTISGIERKIIYNACLVKTGTRVVQLMLGIFSLAMYLQHLKGPSARGTCISHSMVPRIMTTTT